MYKLYIMLKIKLQLLTPTDFNDLFSGILEFA